MTASQRREGTNPPTSSPVVGFALYQSLPDRVRTKIAFDADGCWLWTASCRNSGYGQLFIRLDTNRYTNKLAHRVVYELLVGPIPEGLQLDHLCRVITCVRPDHLEPVTQRENIARGESATVWQARKTHCHKGHPFAGDNLIMHKNGRWRICRTCKEANYEANRGRRNAYARERERARRERWGAA